MPLLRPSNSDFLAFVKAAASNPAGGAVRSAASVGAPPVLGRGAAVRASYAGTKSSPGSSVIQLPRPVGGGAAAFVQFVADWTGKLAVVTTLATGFSSPVVSTLPNGNTVVANHTGHTIQMITPAGVVTTIAGNGTAGFVDGTGTAAQFRSPRGIAVLPDGNFAVADTSNHRIRLVTPAGVVTTIAGNGGAGFGTGIGTNAQFDSPEGIAALPNGDIVVSDTYNNRIRLISMPSAVITTLIGDGTTANSTGVGTDAKIFHARGVAVLPNGNIVVADTNNNVVKLITMPGAVVTTLGSGFSVPIGVAGLPNGNIVVAEFNSHLIKLITMPGGTVTTLAGSSQGFVNETGTAARFNQPHGIAVLPNASIVVGDWNNSAVRLITPT
jgi:serine/threonine-protein kinase